MGPNFEPSQPLPDDQIPITVPIGVPNQFGGAAFGPPSDPDPATTAALIQQRQDQQRLWLATHDPNTGAPVPFHFNPHTAPLPSTAAPAPAPVPGAAPLGAASPNAPDQQLTQPQQPQRSPGVGAGTAGLPPGSGDLQKLIQQGTQKQDQALTDLGNAQKDAADANADAHLDLANTRRDLGADMAAQQLYVRERQQKLDTEDAANLQRARDQVIPDFFQSREGALAGAAITVGLSGAAAALLGSTHNTALEAITHNVDAYYQRQQQRVQDLYKYAEMKGKVNDQTRHDLAASLTDLAQQHAYTLQSLADRIDAVAAQSKGRVDQAQTDFMKSQLQTQAAHELQVARGLDVQLYDAKSKRIEANAAATKASIEKENAGNAKLDKALETEATAAYVPIKKSHVDLTGKIEELETAKKLLESGNPESIQQAKDLITRAATGGKITKYTDVAAMKATGGLGTQIANALEELSSGKPSSQALKTLQGTVETSRQSARSNLEGLRSRYEGGLSANPIVMKSPNAKAYIKAKSMGIFGAPEEAAPAQTPQSVPIGAKATSGGKAIVMTATGWQLAQ